MMNKFQERLLKAANHLDRIALLDEPDCPAWLVRTFCLEDSQLEVIKAAIKHPLCLPIWESRGLKRIEEIIQTVKYTDDELQKIISNTSHLPRMNLAEDTECPLHMLKIFCEQEQVHEVVRAAIINPMCKEEWVELALTRLPELRDPSILDIRKRRLDAIHLKTELEKLEKEHVNLSKGDRDQIILEHIKSRDNIDHASSHLGVFDNETKLKYIHKEVPWADTEKYKIAMVMAPSWGVLFPPYNVAKLTGMLRSNGYSVKVYDANIEAFHYLEALHSEDYWRSERYFLWTVKENFEKFLLPHLQEIFWRIIKDIVATKPKVVGFSMYSTNRHATLYLMKEIRYLLPDVCIVVGGPEIATGGEEKQFPDIGLMNYVFVGEAEEQFLYLLENLPEVYPDRQLIGSTDSKLNLDTYAYPDYTDYVLSNYLHKDGVSIETSRGCVAQCSFCAETYFWRFRSMTPDRVVEEMEYQIETHGVSRFWFVDSLVNGNLKNFRRLVDLINEKQLAINWNSYARCDGRMDEEFIKDIATSGCTCLSYGVESGSQKVLHDMRKKIEIWEIEENLKHSHNAGIFVHANWMVGFPTEEPIDQLHSWQLLYNCRKWIGAISPGFTAGPAQASHMDTNWKDYGIQWNEVVWDNRFLDNWWTKDYQNTNLHRFLRLKLTHIWFEIIQEHSGSIIINSQRYDKVKEFYTFIPTSNPQIDYVPYDHNVKLDRLNKIEFKNSIANEYFTIAYCLWLHYGACSFEFTCDKDVDKEQFGNFLSNMYDSKFTFVIDSNGNYKIQLNHVFFHETSDVEKRPLYKIERERKDQSFAMSYSDEGNINNWIANTIQSKETIHEQYRQKKKVFQLVQEQPINE